jgi:hypothetical protein
MGDPILDLAAKLFGCKRSELIEVRDIEGGGLSVIAGNWQRKEFTAGEIALRLTPVAVTSSEEETPLDQPITIDLSDGISAEEASFAAQILAQRKHETEAAFAAAAPATHKRKPRQAK